MRDRERGRVSQGMFLCYKHYKYFFFFFRALTLASNEVRFQIDSETHDPIDVESKQIRLDSSSVIFFNGNV